MYQPTYHKGLRKKGKTPEPPSDTSRSPNGDGPAKETVEREREHLHEKQEPTGKLDRTLEETLSNPPSSSHKKSKLKRIKKREKTETRRSVWFNRPSWGGVSKGLGSTNGLINLPTKNSPYGEGQVAGFPLEGGNDYYETIRNE